MISAAAASTLASQTSRGSALLVFIRTAHSIYVPTAKRRLSSPTLRIYAKFTSRCLVDHLRQRHRTPPKMGDDMAQLFAAIRRAKVKPGMSGEFAKRVEAGALPVM